MATPTFESLQQEYRTLWQTMRLGTAKSADITATAKKIIAKKTYYLAVEVETQVPWFVVGVIHAMEGACDFKTHLHNGDPLTARTRQVPANRPRTGKPPFTWKESACDALLMKNLQAVHDWPIERICYELERYNGWGYRQYHPTTLSPYLWSGTNHYVRGKYIADGKWSATAVSGQSGAMAIIKRMMDLDDDVAAVCSTREDDAEILDEVSEDEAVSNPALEFPKAEVEADVSDKPGLLSSRNFARVNEMADQGSRIAGWIRSVKRWFWGTTVTVGTASALVDTNKGSANAFTQMVSEHPFIAMAVAGAIVGLIVYVAIKVIERGLVSAYLAGRYKPRGA